MDLNELRIARIRVALQAAERIVDLQARRHMGVLVVGLTLLGSALLGHLARQIDGFATAGLIAMSLAVVGSQLRGLTKLAHGWEAVTSEALADIDGLIRKEGESDDDGQAAKPGRVG